MSRIVIADRQPFVRAALRQRLAAAGHEVVGEAGDGREALGLVQRLHPDLLILDLDLPRLGGLELLRRLKTEASRQKTLVFTNLSGAHYQELCLGAGARGYVHKGDLPEELDEAIKLVLRGRQVYPAQAPDAPGSDGQHEHITPRELTVLQYLAQGYRVRDIAEELAISDRTVSTYKTRLLEKTQSDSLVGLVEAAKVRGLLSDSAISRLASAPLTRSSKSEDLAQLLNILPNAVSLWSKEGTLLACNQSFADIYQKSEAELVGSRVFGLGKIQPHQIERARQEFLKGAASGQPFSLIIDVHSLGERHTLRAIGVPLKEESGDVIGVLASYVDITEHERYVERLQESKTHLESLYARRTGFLLSSGQELLSEVDALGGLLSAARARHPDDPALSDTEPYVARVREKLDILLDLIHLEQGTVLAIPQPMELNQLTRDALETAQVQPERLTHDDDVWGWVDPNRYRRMISVLLRCLDNAGLPNLQLKADGTPLPHGELEWQLTLRTTQGEDIQAHLAGIEKQARAQLCQRLCHLLGGELRIGSDTDATIAALIQLKLPKGSPHF